VTLRRIIYLIYAALIAALAVMAGLYFVELNEEYTHLKAVEAKNRHRLEEDERHLAEQQQILDRLRHDPAYVEMVIRRNLGYAKPDESIFRFDK
jgi:cell division protein DivIC